MTQARVTADYGVGYLVLTPDGEREAVCPRGGTVGGQRPVAGDLVTVSVENNLLLIREILPRKHIVARRDPDPRVGEHILAVNCAHAMVFLSAGRRRRLRVPALLERWLLLLRSGDIAPAVLVNKIDTDPGWQEWFPELEAVCAASPGGEIPLFPVSLLTGQGWEELASWLNKRRSAIKKGGGLLLAGPSGVGKSTFVNRLAGSDLMTTGEIREADGRGRHTTTHRRLLDIPKLFPVMDTPGLKELGIAGSESETALEELYPEITELAASCRFRDCRHSGEPGCAVQEALARGEIDFRRFRTWLDMSVESRTAGEKRRK